MGERRCVRVAMRFQPHTFTEEEKEEESRSLGGAHRDEGLLIWGNASGRQSGGKLT